MTEYDDQPDDSHIYTAPDLSSKKSLISMLIEWIDNAPDCGWYAYVVRSVKLKLWLVEPLFLVVFLVSSIHLLLNY